MGADLGDILINQRVSPILFVRAWLMRTNTNPYDIWQRLMEIYKFAGYRTISYESFFRNTMNPIRRAGLVEVISQRPGKRSRGPRVGIDQPFVEDLTESVDKKIKLSKPKLSDVRESISSTVDNHFKVDMRQIYAIVDDDINKWRNVREMIKK